MPWVVVDLVRLEGLPLEAASGPLPRRFDPLVMYVR